MKINIIKAWKDEEYRSTLSSEELAEIENPAGKITMTNQEMGDVNGGGPTILGCGNTWLDCSGGPTNVAADLSLCCSVE